jgi:hypothetical protein
MPVDYVPDGKGGGRAVYDNENSRVRVFFKRQYIVDEQKILETGNEADGIREEILIFKKVRGDTNVPSAVVKDYHKKEFPREWEAFQRGNGDNGVPLTKLYGIHPRSVAHLRHLDIYTIEELLAADEEKVKAVPDIDKIRTLAGIFTRTRESESGSVAILEELELMKAENKRLEAHVKKLKTENTNLKKKGKPTDESSK